jgi:tRNA (guanine-N7-)-methyltransferase
VIDVDTRPAASIRTYHPRRGRQGARHRDALRRLWPRYGVPIPAAPAPAGSAPAGSAPEWLDPVAVFGRAAPLVLEIGSGMGHATARMAQADPDRDYLAVDVHTPGVANLLALIEERGLANVRVAHGDALDLVRRRLAPGALDAIHAFFPDPWPKSRHRKRRLIQPSHVRLLASRLAPGGTLHCATDSADYASAMLATLTGQPGLVNAHDGFAPRPAHRPVTGYEARAVESGRTTLDLVFRKS